MYRRSRWYTTLGRGKERNLREDAHTVEDLKRGRKKKEVRMFVIDAARRRKHREDSQARPAKCDGHWMATRHKCPQKKLGADRVAITSLGMPPSV